MLLGGGACRSPRLLDNFRPQTNFPLGLFVANNLRIIVSALGSRLSVPVSRGSWQQVKWPARAPIACPAPFSWAPDLGLALTRAGPKWLRLGLAGCQRT